MTAFLLTTPFSAKLIVPTSDWPLLRVEFPWLAVALVILGLSLCVYAYFIAADFRKHIAANWARSEYLQENRIEKTEPNSLSGPAALILQYAPVVLAGLLGAMLLLALRELWP